MVHIIPASEGCLTSSMNRTFFFAFSFLFSFVSEDNTMSSSSPSMFLSAFSIFLWWPYFHANNPYSYALSGCNGSTLDQIFCLYFHVFLFSYYFILFHFFSGHLLLLGLWLHLLHFLHRCLYCLLYAPKAFSFSTFFSFLFFIFCTCDSIFCKLKPLLRQHPPSL